MTAPLPDLDHVDFENVVLHTPSGYRTHWTRPEEARKELEALGLQIVRLEEKGKGVLVAFRSAFRRSDSMLSGP